MVQGHPLDPMHCAGNAGKLVRSIMLEFPTELIALMKQKKVVSEARLRFESVPSGPQSHGF